MNQHTLGLLVQLLNTYVTKVILSPTILMASNYGDQGSGKYREGMDSFWGTELDLDALPNFVGVTMVDAWVRAYVEESQKNSPAREDGQLSVRNAMNVFEHAGKRRASQPLKS